MGIRLLQFLFPERCRGCTRIGVALCETCIDHIPFAVELPSQTYAVFEYGHNLVRATVRDLKYHRRSESARALANAAAAHISEYLGSRIQAISSESLILVPIPEHKNKERSRGFNQSALLAQWWQRHIPESSVVPLLQKTAYTLPQAHLKRHARLRNVERTMKCSDTCNPHTIYVVIDDVTTTGATFTEARRALKAAGAKKVFCVALAHGYAT